MQLPLVIMVFIQIALCFESTCQLEVSSAHFHLHSHNTWIRGHFFVTSSLMVQFFLETILWINLANAYMYLILLLNPSSFLTYLNIQGPVRLEFLMKTVHQEMIT